MDTCCGPSVGGNNKGIELDVLVVRTVDVAAEEAEPVEVEVTLADAATTVAVEVSVVVGAVEVAIGNGVVKLNPGNSGNGKKNTEQSGPL